MAFSENTRQLDCIGNRGLDGGLGDGIDDGADRGGGRSVIRDVALGVALGTALFRLWPWFRARYFDRGV